MLFVEWSVYITLFYIHDQKKYHIKYFFDVLNFQSSKRQKSPKNEKDFLRSRQHLLEILYLKGIFPNPILLKGKLSSKLEWTLGTI